MKLMWTETKCPIFGRTFHLEGLRDGEGGNARAHGDRFIAMAFVDGHYLSHRAGTLAAAMKRLEREIEKRSIDLLGVHDVTFDIVRMAGEARSTKQKLANKLQYKC